MDLLSLYMCIGGPGDSPSMCLIVLAIVAVASSIPYAVWMPASCPFVTCMAVPISSVSPVFSMIAPFVTTVRCPNIPSIREVVLKQEPSVKMSEVQRCVILCSRMGVSHGVRLVSGGCVVGADGDDGALDPSLVGDVST